MADTPACPRCGYDQRGVIDSWTQSCPLTGICSECGLEFAWGDVLGVRAKRLTGFFEHAMGLRRSLWWAWRTWVWTIIPDRFWSRIRMHHRVSPKRIWLWLLFLLLPLYATGSILMMAAVWTPYALGFTDYNHGLWIESVRAWLSPLVEIWPRQNVGFFGGWNVSIKNLGVLQWPLCLTIGLGVWLMLALMFALLTDTRRVYKVRLSHTARVCVYGLAWVVPIVMLYTLFRAWVAAEFIWAMVDGTAYSIFRESGVFGRFAGWMWSAAHQYEYVPVAGVLAWIAWWWWVALDKGLQIERSGRIWCVLMVPAALATAVIVLLIYAARVSSGATGW